ncbi:MAG: glycosyltransferase family 2 protein [Pseudomonadales bacterium]
MELSVVIPCLNEQDTISVCVEKARSIMTEHEIEGEVIVADNGSSDQSIDLAETRGARIVRVTKKGYGNALMGGIEASRGRFVLIGDADDSYDFLEIPKFIRKLREGFELVQGCRLPSGGGTVLPGAMPFSHRWLGNPMLTMLVRVFFKAPIHDVYCGMRGFTKELYGRLDQRCTGMEFATEMIIKATFQRASIAEVPITLHPDGRVTRSPHLRTMRDGWRTLRFFLLLSPFWLFHVPGLILSIIGLAGYAVALPGVTIGSATFGGNTLMVASFLLLVGFESMLFGLYADLFAMIEKIRPPGPLLTIFWRLFRLEWGLIAGATMLVIGAVVVGIEFLRWMQAGFGPLEYSVSLRRVIPGTTLSLLGFQTVIGSFLISIETLQRK